MLRTDLRRLTVLGWLAIASGLAGCSVFKDQTQPKLAAEVQPGSPHPPAPVGKFSVELRPEKGKPRSVEKEMTEPVHVQTALEQTGAAQKWPRCFIELYRPLPNGGWHRMQLEFDRENHRVPAEFDYAVLPGDRIVVTEDATNLMDDFMQRALKPLGIDPSKAKRKPTASERYQIRG
jgi:hypothetical protein